MTRDQSNKYERDCVLRAGVTLSRRTPDDTAQRLIRNIERRKTQQKEGEKVCD